MTERQTPSAFQKAQPFDFKAHIDIDSIRAYKEMQTADKGKMVNSCYYSYQRSWHTNEANGSFPIVLTPKPRLHVVVNKRNFVCGFNCNESYWFIDWLVDCFSCCNDWQKVWNMILHLKLSSILPLGCKIRSYLPYTCSSIGFVPFLFRSLWWNNVIGIRVPS